MDLSIPPYKFGVILETRFSTGETYEYPGRQSNRADIFYSIFFLLLHPIFLQKKSWLISYLYTRTLNFDQELLLKIADGKCKNRFYAWQYILRKLCLGKSLNAVMRCSRRLFYRARVFTILHSFDRRNGWGPWTLHSLHGDRRRGTVGISRHWPKKVTLN